MKKCKQFVAVLMTVVITLSLALIAPINVGALTQAEFNSKISSLKITYPNGSVCRSTQFGYSCFGWAYMIGYNVFGTNPSSWSTSYSLSSVKVGDIIQYGNTSGAGHTVFVVGVSGNTIAFADCNGNGNRNSAGHYVKGLCMVKWDNYTTISANSLFGYGFSYIKKNPGIESGNKPEKQWYDNYSPINLGNQFYAFIKNKKTGNLISESNVISEYANDVNGMPYNGKKTQTWLFNRNSDGSYSIKNLASNMYLDVEAGNNINNLTAQPNGTNIITYYKYNGTGNQKFFIYRIFDSYYLKPVGMNRIVDMGIANGLVAVWDYHYDFDPQKFDIIRVDVNNELPIDLGDQFCALIKNQKTGNLISESNVISEYANDVNGMPYNGKKTQTWLFNRNNDGSYSIKNLASNMYLDVEAGNNINNLTAQPNGTNIITYYKYNGTGNQKFFIYRIFDSYYIKPVGMNRVVDMGISNGLVAVWDYGENFDPQKFDIIKIEDKEKAIGDVNSDGEVTIDDVTLIQKYLADLSEFTDNQKSVADVNGDGEVMIDDVTMIQKYLAGIITKLG